MPKIVLINWLAF